MAELDFGGGRGPKDSDEQVRMGEGIMSIARSRGCRAVRLGMGGYPQWEIKVVEPGDIYSTLAIRYDSFRKSDIQLIDERGRAVAEAIQKLLATSFNIPNVQIVASRKT